MSSRFWCDGCTAPTRRCCTGRWVMRPSSWPSPGAAGPGRRPLYPGRQDLHADPGRGHRHRPARKAAVHHPGGIAGDRPARAAIADDLARGDRGRGPHRQRRARARPHGSERNRQLPSAQAPGRMAHDRQGRAVGCTAREARRIRRPELRVQPAHRDARLGNADRGTGGSRGQDLRARPCHADPARAPDRRRAADHPRCRGRLYPGQRRGAVLPPCS